MCHASFPDNSVASTPLLRYDQLFGPILLEGDAKDDVT
jgi:hypothetical protein